jgi:hypothetical protein
MASFTAIPLHFDAATPETAQLVKAFEEFLCFESSKCSQ